jgi:hypothetical protein
MGSVHDCLLHLVWMKWRRGVCFRFNECEVKVRRGRTRDEKYHTVIEIRWTDTEEKEDKRNGEQYVDTCMCLSK